jgi:predicted lipoprotein with Yx(FWY)xxD motif
MRILTCTLMRRVFGFAVLCGVLNACQGPSSPNDPICSTPLASLFSGCQSSVQPPPGSPAKSPAPISSGGAVGSGPSAAPSGSAVGSGPSAAPSGGAVGSGPSAAPSGGAVGSAPSSIPSAAPANQPSGGPSVSSLAVIQNVPLPGQSSPPGFVSPSGNPVGLTLYVFDQDTRANMPTCPNIPQCPQTWFLQPGINGTLPTGWSIYMHLDAAKSTQLPFLSFNGHPVYTNVNDKAPGSTNGDGVNGIWHIARPTLQALPP